MNRMMVTGWGSGAQPRRGTGQTAEPTALRKENLPQFTAEFASFSRFRDKLASGFDIAITGGWKGTSRVT